MTTKECFGCDKEFKPFYTEQLYCEVCREESAEGLGWSYDDNGEPKEPGEDF